jgi:hypothetical protein
VKIRKAYRFLVEAIQMGRSQDRIAMARQVTVSLVVRHDQDDVGATAFEVFRANREEQRTKKEETGQVDERSFHGFFSKNVF